MPMSATKMFQRVAAGLLMLAFLVLGTVHPASAHGAGHRHTASQNAGQLVMADHHRSGYLASSHGCGGCPDCCATGQCSMASAALPSGPFAMVWPTHHVAVFGRYAARDAAGPAAAPATPPPRLDA